MLVSVIIPVYNSAKYIEKCMDSVISQSLMDIEIICVYNSSLDESRSILFNYQKKDKRIKIVDDGTPKGLSVARNIGLEIAKGDYICFVDSDDCISNKMLEELTVISKYDDLDVIYFDYDNYCTDTASEKLFDNGSRFETYEGIFTGKLMFEKFYEKNDHGVPSWRAFYKREFLNRHNLKFYKGIYYEDVLFYFQVIMLATRVKCLNKVYYHRFRHMDAMTAMPISVKHLHSSTIVYAEIQRFCRNNNIDLNESIELYLSMIAASILSRFWDCIHGISELSSIEFDTDYQEDLFQNVLAFMLRGWNRQFFFDDIRKIKKFRHVIIYGAGVMARRLSEILIELKIDNFHFAVTRLSSNEDYIGGCKVKQIDDFVKFSDDSFVIVAMAAKYHGEVIQNLKRLGFKNYILNHSM